MLSENVEDCSEMTLSGLERNETPESGLPRRGQCSAGRICVWTIVTSTQDPTPHSVQLTEVRAGIDGADYFSPLAEADGRFRPQMM